MTRPQCACITATCWEAAGYAVDEAVNSIEALEKALQQPYDLYVVDINMPKLIGYGFLRELRSPGYFPGSGHHGLHRGRNQ